MQYNHVWNVYADVSTQFMLEGIYIDTFCVKCISCQRNGSKRIKGEEIIT